MRILQPSLATILMIGLIAISGCESELTEKEETEVLKRLAIAIPKDIMDGVDVNSPKGAYLSYKIALQKYDKKEFAKYVSSEGVTFFRHYTETDVQFKIDENNFEENWEQAINHIPSLIEFRGDINESISGSIAYINITTDQVYIKGQIKLLQAAGKWRIFNETWSDELPIMKTTEESICESKILGLVSFRGEPRICWKVEGDEGTIEFMAGNDAARHYVYALNVTLFGESGNVNHFLEKPIEVGLAVKGNAYYRPSEIGEIRRVKISPHVRMGKNYSCTHKNSSIEVDFRDIKKCEELSQ